MRKNSFIFKFLLVLTPFLLNSCLLKLGGVSGGLHLRSISDDEVSDSNYFYVDLDSSSYELEGNEPPYYDINTTESYGNGARGTPSICEIPYDGGEDENRSVADINREKTANLICILDVPEGDLKLKDIKIEYNFPAGMCHHYRVSLPWHYNWRVGEGEDYVEPVGDEQPDEEINYCKYRGYNASGEIFPCCWGGKRQDQTPWVPSQGCYGGPALISVIKPMIPFIMGQPIFYLMRVIKVLSLFPVS